MNVFICFTPFQLFLAMQIIKLEGISPTDCTFFLYNYHDRLKVKNNFLETTKDFDNIYYESQPFTVLFVFKLFSIARRIGKIKTVYVASIDNNITHYLLSFMTFDAIKTFDDGTANITKLSLFYREVEIKYLKYFLHLLLGRRYNREKIKAKSEIHYTVYKGFNNIIERIKVVEILQKKVRSKNNSKIIKIMLGSVYHELANCSGDGFLFQSYVYSQCTINNMLYIPHPREDLRLINFPYISDWRISEQIITDYIIDGYEVHLYGFPSSTFFNLNSVPNVKCHILLSDKLRDEFKDLVSIAQAMQIQVIDVPREN